MSVVYVQGEGKVSPLSRLEPDWNQTGTRLGES